MPQSLLLLIVLAFLAIGIYKVAMEFRPSCERCGAPLNSKTCTPVIGDDYWQILALNNTGTHHHRKDSKC